MGGASHSPSEDIMVGKASPVSLRMKAIRLVVLWVFQMVVVAVSVMELSFAICPLNFRASSLVQYIFKLEG